MLTELSAIPTGVLPLAVLRQHLRLGTGFGEDTLQDGLLEGLLRASIALIEGRTGQALIRRDFELRLSRWRRSLGHPFPVAPVVGLVSVAVIDRNGAEALLAEGRVRLGRIGGQQALIGRNGPLPVIPSGGEARIVFSAGFGESWEEVPADLAQAILVQSAALYEQRDGAQSRATPFGVMALVERWRAFRGCGV